MKKRILLAVSNVAHYDDVSQPTGLWLSELTHAYRIFEERGYEQCIVSPRGGLSPLELRSLKWPNADGSVRTWLKDSYCRELLSNTTRAADIDPADFDAIYFTGGHAVMYDFPNDPELQRIARGLFERGKVVSAVCHGYCGLLNIKLSDGTSLVENRRLTGYSWLEEVLAGVAKKVPYNAEEAMKQQGARYTKGILPFVRNIVVDGRLVTGQNPASAKQTAKQVVALL